MGLKERTKRLETAAEQAVRNLDMRHSAKDALMTELTRLARTVEHETPDEDWCAKASPIVIASKAILEIVEPANSPAFWDRVAQIARSRGPVGKLFCDLEAKHAEA